MLDGLAAGMLVVDFCLNLIKATFCFLIPSGQAFVFPVVVCLVLCYMGVLVNAVLYQPCDNVQFISQFCFLLFKSGGVKDGVLDKTEGLDDRVLFSESPVCRRYERRLYLFLGQMRRGALLAAVLVVASPDDLTVFIGAVPDL